MSRKSKLKKAEQKSLLHTREDRRFLIDRNDDFFLRESYKTLRTNVMFSLPASEQGRVIAVTSAMQGEGKSSTSINLALSYAATGKRVLLIDCDLRRPKLAQLLGASPTLGLTDMLISSQTRWDTVYRYNNSSMDVLLTGRIPPNPSEMLGSERMAQLLQEMRGIYDYIILDTPPINMVSDALSLSPATDGVVMVIREGQSERGAVSHALDQLEYGHARILGFVLNGIDLDKSSYRSKYGYKKYGYRSYAARRGYRRGYGYGNGYGYGYGVQPGEQPGADRARTGGNGQ